MCSSGVSHCKLLMLLFLESPGVVQVRNSIAYPPFSLLPCPPSLVPSFPRSLVPSFPRSLAPSFPRSLPPSFPPPSYSPSMWSHCISGDEGGPPCTRRTSLWVYIQYLGCWHTVTDKYPPVLPPRLTSGSTSSKLSSACLEFVSYCWWGPWFFLLFSCREWGINVGRE